MEPVTAPASLVEILPILETKKTVVNHNGNGTAFHGIKHQSDREKVEQILSSLENVRLTMKNSSGQGFLFSASASIRLFLQQ